MPASDTYFTIARSARSDLRVKASRFFGFVERVHTQAEAEEQRFTLKKKYHDAAHLPFAYRLPDGGERSSDDGEPKGTAGSAILEQIRGRNLYGVQVVVVRYFGGTKLGRGGLSRAFSDVTRHALDAAGRREIHNRRHFSITLQPDQVETAKTLAGQFTAAVDSISYDTRAHLRFAVPVSRWNECLRAFAERFGLQVSEDKR
jgi:uncharacterized YigZ family protein